MSVAITLAPTVVLTFCLYFLAVVLTAIQPRSLAAHWVWHLLIAVLFACGLIFNLLQWVAAVPLMLLYGTMLALKQGRGPLKLAGWLGAIVSALALALHLAPGFNNPLIMGPSLIGKSTIAYALHGNLDMGLAGIILLYLSSKPNCSVNGWWRRLASQSISIGLATASVVALGAILGLGLDPKFGAYLLLFALFNLLVTCFAEEAFFRLLIQQTLVDYLADWKYAKELGLLVVTLLFGIAHWHGGVMDGKSTALITFAGGAYAWVYYRTGEYWSAVATHFLVNMLHFGFFVYPASFP